MTRLGAIAPYFGSKRSMAADIIVELGSHRFYLEPFCGSLAVLIAKERVAFETVNDLHGDIVNLAMVLASDHWRELYELVDRLLLCEDTIRAFQKECAADFTPPESPWKVLKRHWTRAAHYMGLAWITRNGVAGTKTINHQICCRWTQGGGSPGIRWRAAVDSVPDWHDRLKGVVIMRRDAFGIIGKVADESGMALYVDPPYFKSSRGSGGGGNYLYDFDELEPGESDDHERLAAALRRFRNARVVVSYYEHPRLKSLYLDHGWTKRELHRNKNLALQNVRGRGQKTQAPEVLLLNGPSYAADCPTLFT